MRYILSSLLLSMLLVWGFNDTHAELILLTGAGLCLISAFIIKMRVTWADHEA